MRILSTIGRRLAMLGFVTLGVTLITFVISRLIPGDPALMMAGPRPTPETLAAIRLDLRLDDPIWSQYLAYLKGLAQGDLGASLMTQQPVIDDLVSYMPATLELMLTAFILSILVGVPLGVATAVWRDKAPDVTGRGLSVLGISTPSFWIGLMLILIFYDKLDWLPGSGRLSGWIDPPPGVTGFYTLDSLIAGDTGTFADAFAHLLLPAGTLALASVGAVVRLVRGSMIEALGEDYIRTARAYGLSPWRVVFQYALPNAMIPFVTVLGLELATLLFGSVVVESVFAWPGLGSHVLAAILNLDFPTIMGFTVLASGVYVLANALVDLLYLVLDPRIREVG